MGDTGSAYMILVRKPEGKRPLRRPRHRWEYIRVESLRNRLRSSGLDASSSG